MVPGRSLGLSPPPFLISTPRSLTQGNAERDRYKHQERDVLRKSTALFRYIKSSPLVTCAYNPMYTVRDRCMPNTIVEHEHGHDHSAPATTRNDIYAEMSCGDQLISSKKILPSKHPPLVPGDLWFWEISLLKI